MHVHHILPLSLLYFKHFFHLKRDKQILVKILPPHFFAINACFLTLSSGFFSPQSRVVSVPSFSVDLEVFRRTYSRKVSILDFPGFNIPSFMTSDHGQGRLLHPLDQRIFRYFHSDSKLIICIPDWLKAVLFSNGLDFEWGLKTG